LGARIRVGETTVLPKTSESKLGHIFRNRAKPCICSVRRTSVTSYSNAANPVTACPIMSV
jgi:hypothetical protein